MQISVNTIPWDSACVYVHCILLHTILRDSACTCMYIVYHRNHGTVHVCTYIVYRGVSKVLTMKMEKGLFNVRFNRALDTVTIISLQYTCTT